MPDNNWKALERKIANDIEGERILQKGTSAPDVIKGESIIIEAKRRKTFSLKKSMEQVEGYRNKKDQILAVIRREPGKNNLQVFMKYSNLVRLIKYSLHSLRNKDFIIQLNYKDFVEMAKKVGSTNEK